LGFYDLRVPEVREAQASLARQYGIYGFCYYHYWFHGKRLLEQPFHEVLESGKPDFPFALCWANEPWTRNWDAMTGHTLVDQRHSPEDDIEHIRWLLGAFADSRYIKIDGRPLMLIYRAKKLLDSKRTTDLWRAEAQRAGFPDLYLCKVESHGDFDDPVSTGFDANVGFLPRSASRVVESFDGFRHHMVLDYASAARAEMEYPSPAYKRFPSVIPGWDNTARRRVGAIVFSGSTPELYEEWLAQTVRSVRNVREEENLLFVVAWNEWAEGNHLEPDERYGRKYLEATRRALDLSRPETKLKVEAEVAGASEPEPDEKSASRDYEYEYVYSEGTAPHHIVSLARDHVTTDKTIVDLGAGAAVVGLPLVEAGFDYHGMDLHPEAIRLMEQAGITASQCDLRDVRSVVKKVSELKNVGALLMIDVIEHLVDPQELLSELSHWAVDNGHPLLLISVPNVANFDVALRLLLGRWDPSHTGLLDSTHLRFFYRDTLERLCRRSGWEIVEERDVEVVRSDQYLPELAELIPSPLVGALHLLSTKLNPNGSVQQYVWALSPVDTPAPSSYLEAVEPPEGMTEPTWMSEDVASEAFSALSQYLESVGVLSTEVYRRGLTATTPPPTKTLTRFALAQMLAQVDEASRSDTAVVLALGLLAEIFGRRVDLQEHFGEFGLVDSSQLFEWAIHASEIGDSDGVALGKYRDTLLDLLHARDRAAAWDRITFATGISVTKVPGVREGLDALIRVYVSREDLRHAYGDPAVVDSYRLLKWALKASGGGDPSAASLAAYRDVYARALGAARSRRFKPAPRGRRVPGVPVAFLARYRDVYARALGVARNGRLKLPLPGGEAPEVPSDQRHQS
jgi:2-polyprenyl-3-methyl-5-hydroxy-6-metoxy-1,4-benzoquinol methylase